MMFNCIIVLLVSHPSILIHFSASSSQMLNKTSSNLTEIKGIKELKMDSSWHIIDLSHNSIEFVDEPEFFRKQKYLETLRLSFNPKFNGRGGNEQIFNQKTLKKFECVNCGFEEIQSQTFTGLISLTELYLSANQINRINVDAFKSNQNLKLLDLANNKLTTLPFSTFDGLRDFEALYLTKNRIELPVNKTFLKSESLKHLKLDECDMPAFYPETFSELRNLESLNLNKNRIELLPVNAFNSNKQLKSLFIEGNQIKIFSPNFLDLLPKMVEFCVEQSTFEKNTEFSKSVKKYVDKGLKMKCDGDIPLFNETIIDDVTTKVPVEQQSTTEKTTNSNINKGVSDFFIGSFISFVLIFQGAVIVYLLFQLIKMTKFEKLDGEVNYANTILNDDEIYVRIR